MVFPVLTICFLASSLLVAAPKWQRVKANFDCTTLPAILKIACYDFPMDFDARVENYQFQEIKVVYAPLPSASNWAPGFIKTGRLLDVQTSPLRRYRLKMKYSHKPWLYCRIAE